MIELRQEGYIYKSDRDIEYKLLEGVSIGGEVKYTSDIIFIMLMNPDYNIDNNIVGYLFGASMLNENLKDYEEGIRELVNNFEERNFAGAVQNGGERGEIMDEWTKTALKNILQAHKIDDCELDEIEFYLETNQFFNCLEEVKDRYEDVTEWLMEIGNIVKTEDGYVHINIV